MHHELEFSDGALDGLGVSDDVLGIKVKLFGDAVYNQDSWVPQVAVGAQYKEHGGIHDAAAVGLPGLTNPIQLGAEDDSGVDYYLSATKVFLSQSMLVNLTLRYTEANQFGLLGFGPDAEVVPEATIAWLLSRKFAVGAEYRRSPTTARPTRKPAWDFFLAWTRRTPLARRGYLNICSVLAPVTGETADRMALTSPSSGFLNHKTPPPCVLMFTPGRAGADQTCTTMAANPDCARSPGFTRVLLAAFARISRLPIRHRKFTRALRAARRCDRRAGEVHGSLDAGIARNSTSQGISRAVEDSTLP